nr:transposase [Roseofilum halophilum]
MLVFETKLYGTKEQFAILDEVLRAALFVRNKCLRLWEEKQAKSRNNLYRYCKTLAESFPWAKKLNSQARQAMAERTWAAIARFYDNCKSGKSGKKGYPKYKRYQTRLSVEYKTKARNRLGRRHLKVQRQRKDWAVKLARCVVMSADVVAYEDLRVSNLVKHHCLAKSISDAAWYQFRQWIEYFGRVFGVVTVAVPPHYTSQKCSSCGSVVKKTLSQRTHACRCGCKLDRDHNAALNILELGLEYRGTHGNASLWTRRPLL